eukprot:9801251-Lingulodinium_polyedra.AAC.1
MPRPACADGKSERPRSGQPEAGGEAGQARLAARAWRDGRCERCAGRRVPSALACSRRSRPAA